ncbi:hypothetical protein D3C80_1553700 [compost metagenome]
MLPFQHLHAAQCTQLDNRGLHRLAVRKILAYIITEVCAQSLNIELGLLDRVIADDQLLKPGLALDQHDFVLRHPSPAAHHRPTPLYASKLTLITW